MRGPVEFVGRFSEKTRGLFFIVLSGLVAGLAAVAFLLLTNAVFAHTFESFARRGRAVFAGGSLLVIGVSSLVVGWLLYRLAPDAAGSGIPQLKTAFWKDLGYIPFRPVWVKFLAGVISLGGGQSLGREGPTVFVSAGCASNAAGALGMSKRNRRSAAAMGAAAGLAAAFNTPLAAIAFVLEEIIGDFSSRLLGGVLVASVIGAFVTYGCVGRQPAFALPDVGEASWSLYVVVPLVAALAALVGVLFQNGTLALRARVRRQAQLPAWLRPLAGGLTTWVIGCAVFLVTGRIGVFGLGYADLSNGLLGSIGWKVAGLLVVAKLAATIACYGFGGCGGIFSPTLFLGGMTGIFLGGLADGLMDLSAADRVILAAVGMSACFGAVVRAPLSALLMVFEMTHQFSLVPALMLGVVVSQVIARLGTSTNFYNAILQQDGHELHRIAPPRDLKTWQRLPVSTIANAKPVAVTTLEEGALRDLVARCPYRCFPVVDGPVVRGMVTRGDIEAALAGRRPPTVEAAVTASTRLTIRQASQIFIKSPHNIVFLVDEPSGELRAVLTLHDLLRAQVAIEE